ncbi:MAG: DUF5996 family protein [Gammaproteobacteria bacterium]
MFPQLTLDNWRTTRDALHEFSRVLGAVRRELTPPREHWWHITLHTSASGLTTTPILAGSRYIEFVLNPAAAMVEVVTSHGERVGIGIDGMSQHSLALAVESALDDFGIKSTVSSSDEWSDEVRAYDLCSASRFWQALVSVDSCLREFKGTLRERTSPVQLFPHHFDLSMNWFSGRLVPGINPADAERAEEQMNFGFVTGDATIADAYLYATAYPSPDAFSGSTLPRGAYWQTEGFTGAILPYEKLVGDGDGSGRLLDFLHTARALGAGLMT